ncbi:MAG TPA: hypothetical protein VK034_05855, partial [Enhygromyxa sp.]|nr:hypothetical protein [Enhygromyxa sp.]
RSAPPSETRDDPPATPPSDAPMSNDFDPSVWNQRCVIAQGYAQGQKIGAVINLGGPTLGLIFADGESQWTVPLGARVRVEGRVVERADLPVFVADPDEPAMQGMPVPPGTDLDQARRRWVIEGARASVIRTPAQAEAELMKKIGERVAVAGILWSRNGVWWLSHEGVDVHLAQVGSPDAEYHGEAVTIRGKLERRPMPRIDQLGIRAEPERAEAFVLRVDAIEPHPIWPLEPCPDHEPEDDSDEPEQFSPATRGSGDCQVTVSALLEATEYRGPGPMTPALATSLDADPDFARMYNSESHGDHHVQCHYQVELAHEPGKHFRWRSWFTNTLRDRTPKACNGMAAEIAEDIIRTTKQCTDLAAGAYWGHTLEPM